MIIVDTRLEERQKSNNPIKAGFIGAGVMARAILNLIEKNIPGIIVAAVYNRTPDKAKQIYGLSGIDHPKFVTSLQELDAAVASGIRAFTDDYRLLCESHQIDVLVDITGTVEFAAELLLYAFKNQKNIITFNAEIDSTLGPILSVYADKAGVIYSGSDGDQPGVTMNLYRFVKGLGLTPMLCGNVKGLHDPYRNPSTQEGFARQWGMGPEKATSFADGTKMNMEQACVANATGMKVAKRGMIGYEHRGHIDEMTSMYDFEQIRALGGIIEYAVGAQPGPGVFVFGATDDPLNKHHLKYYKLGEGPLYSFYTPYHLCIFEVPTSIARVVDFHDHVLKPLGAPVVEVIARAKTDLKAGMMLDGPGYYTVYGECENSDIVIKENLLPIGLADKVKLIKDLPKDKEITFDDIEYNPDNIVYKLYKEQKDYFRK
ncbi:MAG: hypothetical protein JXB19_09030 [Bacteroidales bacterium]|nr:hypothetical protein [Bacteroidales bacterium]